MEKKQITTLTLRLPTELHQKFKEQAAYLGISLNELICYELDKVANTFSGQTQPTA